MQTIDRAGHRTLLLAALGGMLEYYDFVVFVLLAPVMGHVFFPPGVPDWLSQLQTYAIFAAGYLARPLGGIIMAHFGDLRGRKQMFMLSVLLMALPTFLMGLLPAYATIGVAAPTILLLLRIVQGAAIGGEIPGAWVFVAEHAPRRYGFACGVLTGGLVMGILLGSLIIGAMNALFSPQQLHTYAWRIPFFLGGLFGLAAACLRKYLSETPIFQEMQAQQDLVQGWPIKKVIREHYGAVIISMVVTWVLIAAIVVTILMTPALLAKIPGISASDALFANCLAVLFLSLSCVGYGWLVDCYGVERPLIFGSLLFAGMSYGFYSLIPQHPNWLFPIYALLGITVGFVSIAPCFMIRAFPAPVRFSGLSFAYNVAYAIFGGITPIVLALLLRYDRLAPAHYIGAVSLLAVLAGCHLLVSPNRLKQ